LYFFHKLLLESFSINTFALVAKISQDAKERMAVRKVLPTAQGREVKTETGEATEVLAEIAGTGK